MTDNDKKIIQDAVTAAHQALQVTTMNLVSARYILNHATFNLNAVCLLNGDELKDVTSSFSGKVGQIKAVIDAVKVVEDQVMQLRRYFVIAGQTS